MAVLNNVINNKITAAINTNFSVETGNELKHFVRMAKILDGNSWIGFLRENLINAVILVANGFADSFDLESLLKLQRFIKTSARNVRGRDKEISVDGFNPNSDWLSAKEADTMAKRV